MWSFRRIDTVIAVVAGIGVGAFLFELAAAGGAARVPRRPQANTLLKATVLLHSLTQLYMGFLTQIIGFIL